MYSLTVVVSNIHAPGRHYLQVSQALCDGPEVGPSRLGRQCFAGQDRPGDEEVPHPGDSRVPHHWHAGEGWGEGVRGWGEGDWPG